MMPRPTSLYLWGPRLQPNKPGLLSALPGLGRTGMQEDILPNC